MLVAKKSALKVTVALFLSASLIGSSVFAFGGGNSGTVITGTGGTNTNRPPRPVSPAPVVVAPVEPTAPVTPVAPVEPTAPVVAPTEPTAPVVDPSSVSPFPGESEFFIVDNVLQEIASQYTATLMTGENCYFNSCNSSSNGCFNFNYLNVSGQSSVIRVEPVGICPGLQ